jgi:hypothetical protein
MLSVVALSGCVWVKAPLVPPPGFIYTQYSAPLDIDLGEDQAPVNLEEMKSGISTAQYIYIPFTYGLLSFAWGDASLDTATKNGKISKVHIADYTVLNVLGIYQQVDFRANGL